MRLPLMLFLLAAVVPVFFGKVRAAPFVAGRAGLALAWIGADAARRRLACMPLAAMHRGAGRAGADGARLLRRAIRQRSEPNLDLMPSNLFTWAIGIALWCWPSTSAAPAMSDVPALTLGVVAAWWPCPCCCWPPTTRRRRSWWRCCSWKTPSACSSRCCPTPWPLPVHGALSAIYLLTVGVGAG
jgi:hypothetical protein